MDIKDLLIIGGGINGVGIARDAAGRGLSVVLCEQGDLASGTSSKSSGLIHGGLRYLEYGAFQLVRKSLKEREVLLRQAPHLTHPLRFIIPHNPQLKPTWMIRAGLFFYDYLSKRHQLPASTNIDLPTHPARKILKKELSCAFAYSDCQVDDARLVIANAVAAREKGANILTHTQVIGANREQHYWSVLLEDKKTYTQHTIQAKTLVNAAGPWVDKVIHDDLGFPQKNKLVHVKGSHIIVPKLYEENFAFLLTNTDKRIIFVTPYLEHYSLIGTTDVAVGSDVFSTQISEEEIDYLCAIVNRYFEKQITKKEVVWHYSDVRALRADAHTQNPSAITRDYAIECNTDSSQAPLLSIFGGKITTYRKLAEEVLHKLVSFFPTMGPAWTEDIVLPGGEIANADVEFFIKEIGMQYGWLPESLLDRYTKQYGTRIHTLLKDVRTVEGLGKHFGADLYEIEVTYLMQAEWATSAEDILWRRTKLGLCFSQEETARLAEFLFLARK